MDTIHKSPVRFFVLLLVCFIFRNTEASPSTVIQLKNGARLEKEIIAIYSYGVKIADGRIVAYQVISEIIT